MKDLTPLHHQRGTGALAIEATTGTPPAGPSEATQPVDGTTEPTATAEPQDAHEGRGPMQTATYETQSVTFRDVPPHAPPSGSASPTGGSVGTGTVGGMLLNTRLRFDGTGSGVVPRATAANFSLVPSGRAGPGTGTTFALPDYLRPQAMGTWRPGTGQPHPTSTAQSHFPTFPTLYSPFATGANTSPFSAMGEFKYGDALRGPSHGLAWSQIFFASDASSPSPGADAPQAAPTPDLHATASQMLAQTFFVRRSPADDVTRAHEELAAVIRAHSANPTAETEAALCREMMEFTTALQALKIGDLPAKPTGRQADLLSGIRSNFEKRFGTKTLITDADNNPQVKALLDALGCQTITEMQRKLGLKEDGLFGERTFFEAQLATMTMVAKEMMAVAELSVQSQGLRAMGEGLERLGKDGSGLLRLTDKGVLPAPVVQRIVGLGYEVKGGQILQQGRALEADEIKTIGQNLYASGVERFMTMSAEIAEMREQIGDAGNILPIYRQNLDNNLKTFAHLGKVLNGEDTGPVKGKLATMTAVVFRGTDGIPNRIEQASLLRQGVKLSDLTVEMTAFIQDLKAAGGTITERDGMVFVLDLTDAEMADITAEANDILNPPAGLEAIYGKLRQMSDQAAELRAIQLTFELSRLDIAQAVNMGLQAFDAAAELKDVTRKMKELQHVFETIADELQAQREAQADVPVERESFIEAQPATHQLPPLDPPGRRRGKGLGGKADEQFDLSALIKRQAEYLRSWDDQLQQEYMQAIEARSVRRTVERREARHVVASGEVLDAGGKAIQVTTTADGRMHLGQ